MADISQQWKNIFDKDILRGSVNIIALYITVYELLEDTIISRPKDFYTVVEFDDRAKQQYEQEVLALYRKEACPGLNTKNKALIASLLWFKRNGAIDNHDIQIFTESRKLRNKITHEMYGAIVEGGERDCRTVCTTILLVL